MFRWVRLFVTSERNHRLADRFWRQRDSPIRTASCFVRGARQPIYYRGNKSHVWVICSRVGLPGLKARNRVEPDLSRLSATARITHGGSPRKPLRLLPRLSIPRVCVSAQRTRWESRHLYLGPTPSALWCAPACQDGLKSGLRSVLERYVKERPTSRICSASSTRSFASNSRRTQAL